DAGAPPVRAAEPAPPVLESVAVRGEVRDDLAHLRLAFEIVADGPGPAWVPIRLDGQALTNVAEADRELPRQVAKDGGWQVEVAGQGRHKIQASLLVPIRPTADGPRLDFAIPEAAATTLDLVVSQPAANATVGLRD